MPENKREEEAVEHDGSDSSGEQSDSNDGEHAGSSAGHANHNSQAPISTEPISHSHDAATNTADNDAAIATMIANNVEAMDTEEQRTHGEAAASWNDGQATTAVEPAVNQVPDIRLPVHHIYYFVQVFDAESQVLRTVGSFFSRLDENTKSALRKHLHWTEDRDFLIWKRAGGPAVTALTSGETFAEVYIPDGACFIVRDKLSKER